VPRPRSPSGRKTPERSSGVGHKPTRARAVPTKRTPTKPRSAKKTGPADRAEAREFDETLIEITDAIVVRLGVGGEIEYVNPSFEEITGYTRVDLEGRNWFETLVPRDRYPKVWEEFLRLMSGGIATRFENPILTKAGEERFIVWRNSELHRGGEIVGTISIGIDISERKREERERARLAEQLTRAQKIEAVGRLAGGVAHSFNNILTTIIGYCELLLAKLPEGSEYRTDAEQIKRAADHATAVTRDLLIFSRREAGTPVTLDLNTVIVQTRLLLRQLLRSDIEIVTALAPAVAPVEADRSQIEQVLVNLVLNASDAMPSGGVVALETKNVDTEEELEDGGITLEPGRYVAMTVKDSGVGIDDEILPHIFEPFFSTKAPESGTGLGLSTVYGIVEESGGRIAVDSKPEAGSRFTIYLPALPSHG
jgi:two-component system cell cycle sensor histidine kinase/response regulator CckA